MTAILTRVYGVFRKPSGDLITNTTNSAFRATLTQELVSVEGDHVAPYEILTMIPVTTGLVDIDLVATSNSVVGTIYAAPSPTGVTYKFEFIPDYTATTTPYHQQDGYAQWYADVPHISDTPANNQITLGELLPASPNLAAYSYAGTGDSRFLTVAQKNILIGGASADSLHLHTNVSQLGVSDNGGIDVAVGAGTCVVRNYATSTLTIYTYTADTKTLVDNTTNRVYIDLTDGLLKTKTSAYTVDDAPLATVVTSGGDITSLTDNRSNVGTTINAGTITGVTAGDGLTGGGSSGTVTLHVVGTTNRIVANADSIDISTNYIGQSSITTLGTISTGAWHGTVIDADHGGTGQTVYVVGDILYASTTSALSKLAAVATGQVLISAGAGTAPAWSSTPTLTSLALGTDPAETGALMFSNGAAIGWEDGTEYTITHVNDVGWLLNGHLTFTDNTYDIGASGATRPRTGYFGTSVVSPVVNATTGVQISGAAATGTVLRGNGTNFVGSTSTLADTYAASSVLIAATANTVSGLAPTVEGTILRAGASPFVPVWTTTFTTDGSTYIALGADPADTGAIRLANAAVIAWEDATECTLTHVDNTGLSLNLALTVGTGLTVTTGGASIKKTGDTTGTVITWGTPSYVMGNIGIDVSDNSLLYDNTWDSATSYIRFRLRTAGTPVNALTLSGAGVATIANGLTVTAGGMNVSSSTTHAISATYSGTTDARYAVYGLHSGAVSGTAYGGSFTANGVSTTNIAVRADASGASANYGVYASGTQYGVYVASGGLAVNAGGATITAGNLGVGVAQQTDHAIYAQMSGAKTAATTGITINNVATNATTNVNKFGLAVTSTGTWLSGGSSTNNYGIIIYEPTGADNNVGLYNLGTTKLGAATTIDAGGATITAGNLGVGVAQQTDMSLYIAGSSIAGTSQYGAVIQPVFAATGTGSLIGVQSKISTAADFDTGNAYVFVAASPTLSHANFDVTGNIVGFYAANQGVADKTVNAYGVYIDAQSGAATTNIGLYNSGTTQLAVGVGIGTAPAVSQLLDVRGTTTTASEQHGFYLAPTFNASATDIGAGLRIVPTYTGSPTYGHGILIETAGGAGTPTYMYGLRIEAQTKGSTNYSIYAVSNAYFGADVSALTFTDRTAYYQGASALSDIARFKSKNGHVDHDALPEFAKSYNAAGEVIGRNLGNTISILIEAVKELEVEVKSLKEKNQ